MPPMRDRGHPDALLSAFLDDELEEATATRVTRHVAACDTCLEELEGLRRARSALRGLPDIAPPAAVFADVPTTAATPRGRGRLAAAGAATVVVALLATAFALGDGESGEVVPPVEVVVVDHVARTGGGPVIQPVDLDR
jgi:anti-sigma factor RsiW